MRARLRVGGKDRVGARLRLRIRVRVRVRVSSGSGSELGFG